MRMLKILLINALSVFILQVNGADNCTNFMEGSGNEPFFLYYYTMIPSGLEKL
jgi:hypothetical protein